MCLTESSNSCQTRAKLIVLLPTTCSTNREGCSHDFKHVVVTSHSILALQSSIKDCASGAHEPWVATRSLPRVRVDRDIAERVAAALHLGGVIAEATPIVTDARKSSRHPTLVSAVGRVREMVSLADEDRVLIV